MFVANPVMPIAFSGYVPGITTGWALNRILAANQTSYSQATSLSQFNQAGRVAQSQQDSETLAIALRLLGEINAPNPLSPVSAWANRQYLADEQAIRAMGINPPFRNGRDALNLIQQKNIRVEFGDMGDSPAHAQWIADQNLIMINRRYQNDASVATRYAISEAIYHEAGHASGNGDDQSSIQEELNCLALNTLAYRYHAAMDNRYAMAVSSSPLIANGVALYSRLFFDPDPAKRALIARVVEKYGDLPLDSPFHPAGSSSLAHRVVLEANQKKMVAPMPYLPQSPISQASFNPISGSGVSSLVKPVIAPAVFGMKPAPRVGARLSVQA